MNKTNAPESSGDATRRRGASVGSVSRSARQDRKDKIEMVLAQANKLYLSDCGPAWRRLCRELGHMTHPESRMPRFNTLLHALWIAASNDQT